MALREMQQAWERGEKHKTFRSENKKGKDNLENVSVDGRILT